MPDQDDVAFMEVAYSGRAEVLITANLRHFPERFRQVTVVLQPIDFIQHFVRVRKPR